MHPSGSSDVPLVSHRSGNVTVLVNPDAAADVDAEAIFELPRALEDMDGGTSRQRALITWWQWEPAWSGLPLFVRRYAHGGLLGPLFGTLFLGGGRMAGELRTAAYACRAGVPTPRPLAVRIERVWGAFVRAHFVCEFLPDSMDMLELCRASAAGQRVPRRAAARSIGRAIARLHEAGIEHADLNLRNVLVAHAFDEPQAHVIDFDRAQVHERLSREQRARSLLRLDRSVRKWRESRTAAGLTDRVRLLRAYDRECGGTGLDRAAFLRTGRP